MRGEKEQYCLDLIRSELFCNLRNNHALLEMDDEAFKSEYYRYCNGSFIEHCFGMVENEMKELADIIRVARPNPSSSEFPDFIFKNGFIEHFQITSSRETRKGATHTKKECDFQRKVTAEMEELEQQRSETPSFDEVRSASWEMQNPEHSHALLVNSFKQNWEKHLGSVKKYSGPKEIGVFLIAYPEIALRMEEVVPGDWVDGMTSGDMYAGEKFSEYRFSRDKSLLSYIYGFRAEIKYVIILNANRYEVIRTEAIPYLLKRMLWEYEIYPVVVRDYALLHCVSCHASTGEKSNE